MSHRVIGVNGIRLGVRIDSQKNRCCGTNDTPSHPFFLFSPFCETFFMISHLVC